MNMCFQVQAFLSQRPPIRKCQIFVAGSEKMATLARAVIKMLRPYAGLTMLELIDVEPNLKLYGSWYFTSASPSQHPDM